MKKQCFVFRQAHHNMMVMAVTQRFVLTSMSPTVSIYVLGAFPLVVYHYLCACAYVFQQKQNIGYLVCNLIHQAEKVRSPKLTHTIGHVRCIYGKLTTVYTGCHWENTRIGRKNKEKQR